MKFLILTLLLVWHTNAVPIEHGDIVNNEIDNKESDIMDSVELADWDLPVDTVQFDIVNDRILETDELNEKLFDEKNSSQVAEEVMHIEEHDFRGAPVEGPPLEQSEQPVLHPIPGLVDLPHNLSGYGHFEVEEVKENDGTNRENQHFELTDLLSPEDMDWSKPHMNVPEHHEDYQPSVHFPEGEVVIDQIELFPGEEDRKSEEALAKEEAKQEAKDAVVKHIH